MTKPETIAHAVRGSNGERYVCLDFVEAINKARYLAEQSPDVRYSVVELIERPADEPEARLTEMNIKAKAGEPLEAYAAFEGNAVKAWAASLVQWFRETGGQNYVTCDLRDPETGEAYQITMQKAGGRTPAQDLCELRADAARYRWLRLRDSEIPGPAAYTIYPEHEPIFEQQLDAALDEAIAAENRPVAQDPRNSSLTKEEVEQGYCWPSNPPER